MRDVKLENGDLALNSACGTVTLEGADARFQSALISICARKGKYIYDRELGSNVFSNDLSESAREELFANEGLAGMENAFVRVEESGDKLKLLLTVDNETREVTTDGYV